MIVELKKLYKTFKSMRGEIKAVDGIDLKIEDREMFVLLGPSGCGKSTMLNLVAGLEEPTGGEILFNSNPVASTAKNVMLSPRERNVAMVFQDYALYPHMKVYDNIAFPLKIAGDKKRSIDESVRKAAKILDITDLLDDHPRELSGGQRQRVAIARAIVREPNLFLLDEPLSNLDAQLRTSMRNELKELQRSLKITTIYVTHDQTEAMTLGDRIAILKKGRVEQVGTPLELYDHPANIFVAQFLGSNPINLFTVKRISEDDTQSLQFEDVRLKFPREKIDELKRIESDDLILGIRPEDIEVSESNAESDLVAEIRNIEPMGRETLLHLEYRQTEITAVTMKRDFEDSTVAVKFNLHKSHLFENR